MTNWLKQRLYGLFLLSLLAGSASYLHAQNSYPSPAKTPAEAGEQFFKLLRSLHDNTDSFGVEEMSNRAVDMPVDFGDSRGIVVAPNNGSVSRHQFQSFKTTPDQLKKLMELLFAKANPQQYKARVASSKGNQTIVAVSPLTKPTNNEVVVIAEDGGYRVDLRATFGRWNNLSGVKLDEEWFRYTGMLPPSSAHSESLLRLRCQSQLKELMLAARMYISDYDERLPLANKWMDVIAPYAQSKQIFYCPSLAKDKHGYAYNQRISQFPQWNMASPARTITIYEMSNTTRNWFGQGTERSYRHGNGWNLAFADGHVKWYKKGEPTDMQFKPAFMTSPVVSPPRLWPPTSGKPSTPAY